MQINMTRLENGVKLITLDGRLDMQGVNEIDMKFTGLVSTEKAGVVVDLSGVPYLASIGIRSLLMNAKALNARGGKLVLLRPVPFVEDVLKTTGIAGIIPVFQELDAACTAALSA